MESEPTIAFRIDEPAAYIELNRPHRANAYLQATLDEIERRLEAAVAAEGVKVVVFGSAVEGRFCSGADLEEMQGRGAGDALGLRSLEVFDAIASCSKPTIASIDGPAVAGGLELALACDLRVATDRATFAMPETSLGLIPAAGGTFRLPTAVGAAMASQMILFGAELDAGHALACGLVSEVVEAGRLAERVSWWAARVAERDPRALRLAKQAIARTAVDGGARELTSCAQALLYELRRSDDGEGGGE